MKSEKKVLIKAVFSEENYVPPTTIGVGKHAYCSLLCHNVTSIISRESMQKHYFGQTLKLQSDVVPVNIRSRSLKKSNSLFSVSKQITCIFASLVQKKTFGSEDRAQKRLNLQFYKDDDLEMR